MSRGAFLNAGLKHQTNPISIDRQLFRNSVRTQEFVTHDHIHTGERWIPAGGHVGLGLLVSLNESDVVKNITYMYMGGARRIGNAQRIVQEQGSGAQKSI